MFITSPILYNFDVKYYIQTKTDVRSHDNGKIMSQLTLYDLTK